MTFLRLLLLDVPMAGTCIAMPPILRVSGRPTDEHISLPPATSHAGPLDELSHRTGRPTAASSRLQGLITTITTQFSPQSTLPLCLVFAHWQGPCIPSVGLAAVLLQGVS